MTLALAATTIGGAYAQEESAAPATPAVVAAVPAALQNQAYITEARPAADAKFYIYLCSASWCGPCRSVMPRVVQQYPEIKAAGGEIIMVCFDRTPEAGQAYVNKYKAAFPVIMAAGCTTPPPGFTPPRGIPAATFVTPDGKELSSGHGNIILNWRAITNQ